MSVRCLARPSSDVSGLRASADPEAADRLEIVAASLGSLEANPEVFRDCDLVFHLAAALSGSTPALFLDNVVGTRKLLAAARQFPPRRFIHVSSLAVHGTAHLRRGDTLEESCPLDPEPHRRDPYTYSKIVQERVVWEICRQALLPVVVVRPGVIYGPGRDCLTNRVGLRLGNVLVRMGGKQPLPYTHVDNCADALVLAGTVEGVEGQSFNIVDDDLPSARELVKRYRREVKALRVVPVASLAIGPLSRLVDWYSGWSRGQLPAFLTRYKSMALWKALKYTNAKAEAELGWRPRIGFPEGLEQTFSWLRDHTRCYNPNVGMSQAPNRELQSYARSGDHQ